MFPARESEDLEESGFLVPVEITVPVLRKMYLEKHGYDPHPVVKGMALVDTGAAASAIDDRVMAVLEIPSVGTIETITPHGRDESNTYNASASFPVIGAINVSLEDVLGCYLGDAIDGLPQIVMLLGRDLLRHFLVVYDGPLGQASITNRTLWE